MGVRSVAVDVTWARGVDEWIRYELRVWRGGCGVG